MSSPDGTFLPETLAGRKPADKRVEQGALSREEILDAAERLMAVRGYDGTSITTISRESGLPHSSIYWHFNSKAGILAAVMERGAERFFAAVAPTPAEPDQAPAEYLHRYVLASLEGGVAHPQFWRLFVLLLLSNDNPDVTVIVQHVRERAQTVLHGVLETAYSGLGADTARRVADALTDYMLAAYDGVFLTFQASAEHSPEELAGQLSGSLVSLANDIITRTTNQPEMKADMTLTKQSATRDVTLPSGTHIRYYEAGESGATPVVLLHGSGPGATGWSNFSGNIAPIAESGFRVIAPDMPGWGDSDAVATKDMDHDKDLVEFLDALGLEKAALVGNSMGAHTAIRFATLHPERITHLVTMGASLGRGVATLFGAGDGPSEGLKVIGKTYRDPSPENMKALVEIMTYDKARFATPELAAARSEAALAHPEHLTNYVDGLPHGAPIPIRVDRSKLPDITAPTLVIHGKDDRVLHFEVSLNIVANIPNSRLVLLNRCGHWAMIEHAEEFNRLVIDFVNNN